MEFNIKKKSTLPFIQVSVNKDGKSDYNYNKTNLSDSTIYFYMKDIETGTYKIAKAVATYSSDDNSIYYQFSKKNTGNTGRYEGEFKIETSQGIIELPLKDKIYINVLDSFSDSDFCCGPNQNINPTPIPPTPAPPGIYYGKVNSPTINSGDISSLTFLTTPTGVNFYITQPEGNGYGYILVPTTITQPIKFRDSNSGCNGFIIPTNNIDTINLVDTEGFLVTYNIYRTYYKFNGEVDVWLCNT
jgi:hypothetical protein